MSLTAKRTPQDLARLLPFIRWFVSGGRKELDRTRYLRLLYAQDRAFLRLLAEFGDSSPAELGDLARSTRSTRFAVLTEPTVVDWLAAAQKRGLVKGTDGEAGRWSLTEEGRARGQGWRRHVGPLFGSITGFVKWLLPLVGIGAAAAFVGDVDWGAVGGAEELRAGAAIAGLVIFLVLYTMLLRSLQGQGALLLIEATRMTGKELPAEIAPAPAGPR